MRSALWLLLALPAVAVPPRVDRSVDAEQAVALALAHSPALAAAREDVNMAREMLAMARARTRPMLSANAWGTYADSTMLVGSAPGSEPAGSRMVGPGGTLDGNLMAMVPLYNSGRLGQQVAAERQRVSASSAELDTMRLELAGMVRKQVRQAALMRAMSEVYARLKSANEERMRIDQAMLATGKVPAYYVLRDEAEVAAAQGQQANALRDYRVMLAELRGSLGLDPRSQLDVADDTAAAEPGWTVEVALDLAARQRPELAGARARLAAAGHDEHAAAAARGPQVVALGMADLFTSKMAMNNSEFVAGVAVSLPLFDGGERRAAARRAAAERARLSAVEQEQALRVAAEVSAACEQLAAARANVPVAQQAVRAAAENYRLAQVRYEAGKSLHVEVLDALRMHLMAETNLLAARFDLAGAVDALRRAVGDPALLGRRS